MANKALIGLYNRNCIVASELLIRAEMTTSNTKTDAATFIMTVRQHQCQEHTEAQLSQMDSATLYIS